MMAENNAHREISGKFQILELKDILKVHFEVNATDFKYQCGYDNQTYIITSEDIEDQDTAAGDNKQAASRTKYVLKVFHEEFSHNIENIHMQCNMMIHLDKNGITSSKPKLTVAGAPFLTYKHADGKTHVIQLLSFIEGEVVGIAKLTSDEYMQIAYLIGQYVSQVKNALKSFQGDNSPRSPNPFHMKYIHMVEDKLCFVQDQTTGDLIRKFWNRIKINLIPKLGSFQEGFIQGDFSDMNLIIKRSSAQGKWKIAGLIDFEDCHYGYSMAELANCLAYFMARAMLIPQCDPVAVAAKIISGYESISSLKDFDKEFLYEATTSRLIVSYVMACYNLTVYPDNEENLFVQAAQVPALLTLLDSLDRDSIMCRWFDKQEL